VTIHSFHLAEVPRRVGVRALARPPSGSTPGLDHLECLSLMRLGAPVLSPDRLQVGRLAVFAQWRDEAALEEFLARDALGRELAGGWHVRLELLRRWSSIAEMEDMVHGRSAVPDPSRHAAAMAERDRRDFHREFATYRFRALSEHGSWAGRRDIVPPSGLPGGGPALG
jgi:hypothetical protein